MPRSARVPTPRRRSGGCSRMRECATFTCTTPSGAASPAGWSGPSVPFQGRGPNLQYTRSRLLEAAMKNLPSWLLFAALSLVGAPVAADELSPQKRADIERLLEMTGATRIGRQMAALSAAHMTQSLRQSHPQIPPRALDVLPEEVEAVFAANIGAFLAAIVPVYHR